MPTWSDGRTEVSLLQMIDSDRWMLEIVAPVYSVLTIQYNDLMMKMGRARTEVFGYQEVLDLSSVPIDTPGLVFPTDVLMVATLWDQQTNRMHYQFIGIPKSGFRAEYMTWSGQLALDAPKREITDGEGSDKAKQEA